MEMQSAHAAARVPGLDPRIEAWLSRALDGRITGVSRPASGGSRMTWFLDVRRDDGGAGDCVLRMEGQGSFTGTEVSLAREAAAYRVLEAAGVPAPRVLAQAPDGSAYLMTRLAGESDLSKLPAAERDAAMVDFIDCLAALHSFDPRTIDAGVFALPATAEDHARLDLAMWQRLADAYLPDLDPLAQYAAGWLWRHAPARVARTVFVQGDTGPGNFVARDGRVVGMVDLEFAHVGDPMDDLAWLRYRCKALSIPLDEPALFSRYTQRSGIAIDRAAIDYYALACDYRCVITTSLAVARRGGARGWPGYVLQTQRYLQEIAGHLGRLCGVKEPAPELPAPVPGVRSDWYDEIVDCMRATVKADVDADLRDRIRNALILANYLRAHDAGGDRIEALDREDCRATLGAQCLEPGALARHAAQAGRAADGATLRYLLRRAARMRHPWRVLLDRLDARRR
ncbi:MAG: phosphotransferase family protein [Gammaproteobacteria bacterium]